VRTVFAISATAELRQSEFTNLRMEGVKTASGGAR
jgi:hypothetical protein